MNGSPAPVLDASRTRQVRLCGPIAVQDGAELQSKHGSHVVVELRDREGDRILEAPALISWAEAQLYPDMPAIVVEIDACLSIVGSDLLDPGQARTQRADLIDKVRHQIQDGPPNRLRREEKERRDAAILEDLRGGMLVKHTAMKHGVSPTTVCKIRADEAARRAGNASG